jgi:hypothetical protein
MPSRSHGIVGTRLLEIERGGQGHHRERRDLNSSRHYSEKVTFMPVPSDSLLSYKAAIPDRHTFAIFLVSLADDLRERPQDWARTDLEEYLRIMANWLMNGLDAFNQNMRRKAPPDPPDWRLFADLFSAARVVDD